MLAQLRVILGLSWLTLGSGSGQKTFWGLLIQSINYHFLSMHLTSIFDITNFMVFLEFRAVFGWGGVRKIFWSLNIQIEKFHFLRITLYHIFIVNPIESHFGPFVAHFGVRLRSKNFLGSPYTIYQLLFSDIMFILTSIAIFLLLFI